MSDNCPYTYLEETLPLSGHAIAAAMERRAVPTHLLENLRRVAGCLNCIEGFWCPWHSAAEDEPEGWDEISDMQENAYLRERNEILQAENDKLREVRAAAKAYVKIRDTIEQKDLRNITDLYAFGRLKIVLKDSYK